MSSERAQPVGDLAFVLHTHMPYVEGFGTYPFGEEWLFDGVIRSYLPLLEVVRDLTMTVTPVLADQLEDPGVQERLRAFIAGKRVPWGWDDHADAAEDCKPAARAAAERTERARDALERCGGDLIGAWRHASEERNVSLMASSATHSILPLVATRPGRMTQIDAGLRSHSRRFGPTRGFWLPECAYAPGLDRVLDDCEVAYTCLDQSAHQQEGDSLRPIRLPAGPVAFPLDWDTVQRVWSFEGYPSHPVYTDFHRQSLRGVRWWSIGGGPVDPDAAAAQAAADASDFLGSVAARLGRHAEESGRRGLVVCAFDTELLGHWWWEGPTWLAEVLARAAEHGVRLVTLPEALEDHPATERPVVASTWGESKDFRTWDSPEVADLAWAARRLELRLLRTIGPGRRNGASACRATRELLAVQGSDWAFLDSRGQAGDYAYLRAINHGRALLEAIDSGDPDSRLRHLAPDLSLAPLLEP